MSAPQQQAASSVVRRLAKSTAAVAVGRWSAMKIGNRAADEGINAVARKAQQAANESRSEELAQGLARQRGWRYARLVLADDWRFVVFDESLQAMAAFPPVLGVDTPEGLRERFELRGYSPPESELRDPPDE